MLSLPSNIILVILLTSVSNLCHCQEEASDHLLKQSPWYITLYITCPSLGTMRTCGGSLINENWILTTATCLQCKDTNAIPMIVADIGLTANNVQNSFAEVTGVGRYIIDKVVTHHKFRETKNNIALLHLQYTVVSSSKHKMMQVTKCYQLNDAMRTNSMKLLSHYVTHSDKPSTDKLSISPSLGDKMKLLKRRKCNKMSVTCKSSESAIDSTEFCATFIQNGNVSCIYDEGMTLGIHSGDDWIMAGIVFEKPRDCNSCPIWFINVCEYYEWIGNIVSSTSMTQGEKLRICLMLFLHYS